MRIISGKEFAERQKVRQTSNQNEQLDESVLTIIRQVQADGDQALFALTEQFDGARLDQLTVSDKEIEAAWTNVSKDFIHALKTASDHIKAFHEAQKEMSWFLEQTHQKWLGQKVTPIEKVGVYVPGGKAAYPSTVLMNAIPAQIAGVKNLVMTTPPDENGSVSPEVLVAADLAGVKTIYKLGGAQAIAALAYGTESVEKVYKIVGPGNAYVARAKKWVYGDVAIDMIAGPSEICIVAEPSAPPAFVAADLLSQAEHDEDAAAICITTSLATAEAIQKEILKQTAQLERQAIIETSLERHGAIIIADNMDEAINIVNDLAPEHLQLMIDDPHKYTEAVEHAGAIFLGNYSPEALGDYFAGPNHTLPTSGTAKFSSPLGVYDFVKKSSIIQYSETALLQAADMITTLARSEQLTAHANAIQIRKDERFETSKEKS
ncbi:Histidinol dehydrogenase [Lentibacillus sp. JNUCC-1]|uniref:histidinol dehydrogenase n=1 Tax=Lentibacillus sp. JNUCC-1 TaxID=2654513 RepID=UPI0012E92BF8|nr:histidinol dehydrogenase [Lentibacillus sp. JNUCC-1]MUV38620.1 Histidinol dehydrogenase [Lentibacillus sp. JNUCC-1]